MIGLWLGAEMGEFLPAVALGTGRSAIAVSAGFDHTCVVLVRCVLEGSGSTVMMMRWNGRGGRSVIPTQLTAASVRCKTPFLHHVFKGAWIDQLCLIAATRTCSFAREASVTCASPGRVRHVPPPPLPRPERRCSGGHVWSMRSPREK